MKTATRFLTLSQGASVVETADGVAAGVVIPENALYWVLHT